ncbi:MAG: hypothetical protein AAGA77_15855 [Bacteroidota bacterium]
MKHLINLFLLLAPFIAVNAQKSMSKGYVKMEITEATSDDQQMAMGLEMMKGSVTEIHFTEGKYMTSMTMMGGMVKMNNLVETETNKMDMLMDAMGNKTWVETNLDEAKQNKAAGAQSMEDFKVDYDPSQRKKILDYDAYMATITIPSQPGMKVVGWITEDIKTDANIIQGMQDLKLKGFPLEFSITNPQMKLTFAATDIKDTVDESVFVLKTDGYKKMTMKEFTESMGGMGAMGF